MKWRASKQGLVFLLMALISTISPGAWAWGGYTHETLANKAASEVTNNGVVHINNRDYVVPDDVVKALKKFPESYNGGVIGPDGFPDLVYGQETIHPKRTGDWLRLVFARAWQQKGTADFQQNLAFAYGFLSHGAGDMWGHTFVNKYAQGVFPSVGDAFTDIFDPSKVIHGTNFDGVTNAARHMITEYYVNDATHGFDDNPDFGLAPFAYPGIPCTDPDVCNYKNSSTGVAIDSATNEFIYNVLIGGDGFVHSFTPGSSAHPDDPLAPLEERGAVIDFFLSLRSKLIGLGASIDPVQDFTNFINDQFNTFKAVTSEFTDIVSCIDNIDIGCVTICDPFGVLGCTDICAPDPFDVAECAAMVITLPGEVAADIISGEFQAAKDAAKGAADLAFGPVINAYLSGWVHDIDDGLRAWNEVGLQSSQGLFDPQTVRELADMECDPAPFPDTTATCKAGFGLFNRLEASLDDFKSDHLWYMLGLPHWVTTVQEILQPIADFIDTVIDAILPINPIKQFLATAYQYFNEQWEQFVRYVIKKATGVDLEAIEDISKSPEAFLDLTVLPPNLVKPIFGFDVPNPGISLFNASDHPQMDSLMSLPADHHVVSEPPVPGWPGVAERLSDSAEFNQDAFAAAMNTVQQTRLLFLDGAGLNQVLSDALHDQNVFVAGASVHFFESRMGEQMRLDGLGADQDPSHMVPKNVMITPDANEVPWLNLIDGDHAWRKDGSPVFGARPADRTGGNGTYPLWTACALRPAFRALFKDWEHPAGSCSKNQDNFCDDGDLPKPDGFDDLPARSAPQTFTQDPSKRFVSGGVTFVGGTTGLTLSVASDGPFTLTSANGKPAAVVGRWRATGPGGTTLQSTDQVNGSPLPLNFTVSGPDGVYNLTFDVQDPCHLFDATTASGVGAFTTTASVTLDATPPVITITKPRATPSYTTADTETITFSANDGSGSGVKSTTATLDGTAATNGQVLDFFLMNPGLHTLVVTSVDNLGNSATKSVTFRVQATAASLLANWDRARSQGLIPEQNLYDTYRALLVTATQQEAAHNWTALASSMNQFAEAVLSARNETVQRNCTTNSCKRIDIPTGSRFVTFADLLQANAGVTNIVSTKTAEGVLELLDNLFLQRQVGTLGSYNALRHLLQQAIGHDRAGQKSTEKSDLQAFVQQVASMVAQTGPSCTNPDSGCYGLSASAGSQLTAAAQAVIATL